MTPHRPEPFAADASPVAAFGMSAKPQEAGLAEIFLTLRKRKYIVLLATLLGVCHGLYKFHTQPRVFIASGTIEIQSGSSSAFRLSGSSSGGGGDSSGSLPSQVVLLKSDTLLLAVGRDLDLANNPHFMGAPGPMPHRSLDDMAIRQAVINILSGDLAITIIPKTDMIQISCATLDPRLSADIVNKMEQDYIHYSMQTRFEASKRASDFLSSQLTDLKQQVEEEQAKVIDLGKRIGVLGFDPNHNQITTDLDSLTRAVGEAEVQRILAESRYKTLSHMDPNALDNSVYVSATGGTGGSPLAQLRTQRESLLVQMAQMATHYGPALPQMKALLAQDEELKKQIQEEEQRLLTQAQQSYVAAHTAENGVRGALEDEKANAYKLRDALVEYTLLQRDFETNRTLYDTLVERLRSAGVEAGLESTEIDIVDTAVPPLGPTLQARSSMLLMSTTVMLILGIAIAFIMENLDTGIQSVAELEAITGLPSLAMIPRVKRPTDTAGLSTAERNIVTLASPKSQFAESFRSLRTSLLLSTPGGEPKIILLTSGTPGEGKTTAAINLSCVLAQRGVRVLLVDADLRRPTVHHRFGINGKTGLTSVLSGSVTLADAVQSFPQVPQLDILVSGPVPPFPTEMLGSEAMKKLLKEASGIYTHIVLDSPPLLSVTDSIVLAREADIVVMVVRHGKSTKHTVRRSRETLARAGAHVAGLVFNAVDVNSPEYYSYYGYYGYTGYTSAQADHSWNSATDRPDSKNTGEEDTPR